MHTGRRKLELRKHYAGIDNIVFIDIMDQDVVLVEAGPLEAHKDFIQWPKFDNSQVKFRCLLLVFISHNGASLFLVSISIHSENQLWSAGSFVTILNQDCPSDLQDVGCELE